MKRNGKFPFCRLTGRRTRSASLSKGMGIATFCIVLAAAALHALWNAIVKRGDDAFLTTVIVTASAAGIAAATLPFVSTPLAASWPYIAASSLFQIIYFAVLARTYRIADLSVAYPLMRGTAPLIVASANFLFIGERLSAFAWLGISVICTGILSIAGTAHSSNKTGVVLAIGNAFVIAVYTLIDGLGVRRSGAPLAYTMWIFLLTGITLSGWTLMTQRQGLSRYARRNWALGLVGGAGTISSYGLALWAMTTAPVAVVAALRETSILFGLAIARLILREKVGFAKTVAVCIIAAGAAVLPLP